MSVVNTIKQLQLIHETIIGVESAPTAFPSNLDQLPKPVVLVWPDAAVWRLQAIDLRRQERTYKVRCYAQPVAQGIAGPDEGYQLCAELIERFGRKYLDDITLNDAVDHITAITDRGVPGASYELMWGDDKWWGFEYSVTVVEKSAV